MAVSKVDAANQIENQLPQANIANNLNFRNIIINGDMSIAQRGTSVAGITSLQYGSLDRFKNSMSSAGTWTQSQDNDVPTGQGFASSLKLDCTTANGSLSAGSYFLLTQNIEGQNLQYIKKGTANAESLTLSFWVKSNKTGTYIVEFADNDNTRTISKSYTIDSTSTWEKKTITIDGDTTGALDNDNGNSFYVAFWLVAGSNFTSGTLATSWQANDNADRAVGQVNLADSTSNNFYLTAVQLEAGTTASDFEFLPYDVNLQRCQRYFTEREISMRIYVRNGLTYHMTYPLSPKMRVAPTGDETGVSFGSVVGSAGTLSTTANSFKYNHTGSTSGNSTMHFGTLKLNAEL